jgi:hypothetical protein
VIKLLETIVGTTKHGYVGVVKAWEEVSVENGVKLPTRTMRKLWSMKTGIVRLSKPDALADAIILKRSLEAHNAEIYAV